MKRIKSSMEGSGHWGGRSVGGGGGGRQELEDAMVNGMEVNGHWSHVTRFFENGAEGCGRGGTAGRAFCVLCSPSPITIIHRLQHLRSDDCMLYSHSES